MPPGLFLADITIVVKQAASGAAAALARTFADDANSLTVRARNVVAVMPGRAGLAAHDLDVLVAFCEQIAAEIGVSLDVYGGVFAKSLAVGSSVIENALAVFIVSNPGREPITTIRALHKNLRSVTSPRL
jgi:hypothetical protein